MPRQFLTSVARAVVARAVRSLTAERPAFGTAFSDIAEDAFDEWKRTTDPAQRRQTLEALARLPIGELRSMVTEIAKSITAERVALLALASYLEAIPERIRQTTGPRLNLPSELLLDSSDDLIRFLPLRAPRFRQGDRVGTRELTRLLGIGGFGEVWLTTAQQAVKFFIGSEAAKHLRHEMKLLDRIAKLGGHPGIVPLIAHDLAADPPYLVNEYISGGDLSRLIRSWSREKPSERIERVLGLMLEIAEALAFLHGAAVKMVHRDLKPANVLVHPTADGVALRLTDLGIGGVVTKDVRGHTKTILSVKAELHADLCGAMTEQYAPAEQKRRPAEADPDPRDDVYALGVIGYQMLLADLSVKPEFGWKRALTEDAVPDPVLGLLSSCIAPEKDRLRDGGVAVERVTEVLRSLYPNGTRVAAAQRRTAARLVKPGAILTLPITPTLDIRLAYIPPGSFLMGSPETEAERRNNEKQHPVTITKGFYMGVYPITQAQWQAVMGTNPSEFSRTGSKKEMVKGSPDAELARFPVETVSWEDAQEFCEKLSKLLGKRVHLPSEAQWEYACRAGTTTPYHFGGVLNGDLANCDGNYPYGTSAMGPYLNRPTPVGLAKYPANSWGLFDMHGNVWEWCQDAYLVDYQTLKNENPLNDIGDRRVVRGGSGYIISRNCRAAYRSINAPGDRLDNIGLRVVVVLP